MDKLFKSVKENIKKSQKQAHKIIQKSAHGIQDSVCGLSNSISKVHQSQIKTTKKVSKSLTKSIHHVEDSVCKLGHQMGKLGISIGKNVNKTTQTIIKKSHIANLFRNNYIRFHNEQNPNQNNFNDNPNNQNNPQQQQQQQQNNNSEWKEYYNFKGMSPKEIIQRLPQFSYQKAQQQQCQQDELEMCYQETLGNENRCCLICLVEFEEGQTVVILPCMHMFDEGCIGEWFEKKLTCPLCNLDMLTISENESLIFGDE